MKPTFLNWAMGVRWCNPINDTSGLFGHWWPTPLWQWVEGDPPLIYQDATGMFHRLSQATGVTDFGSIPWGIRILPGLGTMTYRLPYLFHDDCYGSHRWSVSHNGVDWELVRVNRQQADERLRDMMYVNPTDPAGAASANIVLAGVRIGGRGPWRDGDHRKNKMTMICRGTVNPHGTDDVPKKA
jgi:hypothetical protein